MMQYSATASPSTAPIGLITTPDATTALPQLLAKSVA
jgi:hypothetical protein